MFREIHSYAGPFWGPRNEHQNIFALFIYILNSVPIRLTINADNQYLRSYIQNGD
jgi:hypothetical protein